MSDFCREHTEIVKTVGEITSSLKGIGEDVKDIKENHLPHIYLRLNNIKSWLIGILVSIIMLLASFSLNLLKNFNLPKP